jgi:hypothetical protein
MPGYQREARAPRTLASNIGKVVRVAAEASKGEQPFRHFLGRAHAGFGR